MTATVLVVDDEKDLVELVQYHLEKDGMKCLEARDGETALQLARERNPDLIVLDLMLPGVDGLEVCRKLRKDPKTASVAIIMLTAKAEEVDRIVGLEMGADDYMVALLSIYSFLKYLLLFSTRFGVIVYAKLTMPKIDRANKDALLLVVVSKRRAYDYLWTIAGGGQVLGWKMVMPLPLA